MSHGSAAPVTLAVALPRRVLLVGNPNVGKSTLFNALTGAHQRVVNAPGTTVELAQGTWRLPSGDASLTDLPGTYSMVPRSPDEAVTAHAIDAAAEGAIALVILDATALSRSLYLLAQVADAGMPMVIALTMADLARRNGTSVDAAVLAAALGTPVIEVNPRSNAGLPELSAALDLALTSPAQAPNLAARPRRAAAPRENPLARAERLFDWVGDITLAVDAPAALQRGRSDRIDRVLLHPWAGIPVFLAAMWALFQLATTAAAPLMDAMAALVSGPASDGARAALESGGIGGGILESALVDGILAGVGTVLSFVPLMAIMFTAIAALESSGYLARVAVMADSAMRAIGLDGRAVLPLIVGFGCNVPALAATKVLPHARQRLLTGMLIPFTSCTARLTVYLLLAHTFFPAHAGTVVFAMYLLSVLLVTAGGLAMRGTLMKDLQREPLVIVLPDYQWPHLRSLASSVWSRVRAFIARAGRIIMAAMMVIWLLLALPVAGSHGFGNVPVADSAYGATASAIAPALEPLGLDDWRIASALITGFVAKEVVVGSLAQTYAVDEPPNPAVPSTLGGKLRATLDESSGGHASTAALAFMVFVLAYTPCLATVAEQRRLFGARWTLGAMGVQLVFAWLLGAAVFQVGSHL